MQRSITHHSTQFKHTYLFICRVLKVAQAGVLVLVQLALLVLVTRRAVRIFSGPVRVVGLDDVLIGSPHAYQFIGVIAYQFIGVIAYQFIGVIAPTRAQWCTSA